MPWIKRSSIFYFFEFQLFYAFLILLIKRVIKFGKVPKHVMLGMSKFSLQNGIILVWSFKC